MADRKYSSDPKQRAAELRAEGKFGGKQPGAGRPRKSASDAHPKRASAVIASYVRENGPEFARVLEDILRDPDASDAIKMRATKLALQIETNEEERQRQDEREGRSLELPDTDDREAVIDHLAAALANPIVRQRFSALLAGSGANTDQ